MANDAPANNAPVDEAALDALAELATPTVTAALGKLGFEFTYATGINPLAPPDGDRMVGRARTLRFIRQARGSRAGPVRGPGVVTSQETRWNRSSRAR